MNICACILVCTCVCVCLFRRYVMNHEVKVKRQDPNSFLLFFFASDTHVRRAEKMTNITTVTRKEKLL